MTRSCGVVELNREDVLMEYIIEVTDRDSIPALYIERTVDAEHIVEEVGSSLVEIYEYLESIGIQKEEPAFVAYMNSDMNNLTIRVGCLTHEPYPGYGEIQSGEVPAGKRVSCLYKGVYKAMGDAYTHTVQWMKHHNLKAKDISYEFYLNSRVEVEPEELITKIEFPLHA